MKLGNLVWLVIISLFVGIILCSIAAGAVFPVLDQWAAGPLVCRHGTFQIHQDTYSYRPGESDTMTTDYCIDSATGVKQDISGKVIIVAGLVDSGVIFVILVIIALILKARQSTKS